jgi:hypothetical protein
LGLDGSTGCHHCVGINGAGQDQRWCGQCG